MLRELQEAARPLGLYVGQHRECRDPLACYYVAYLNEHGRGILKFSTAEQVRVLLSEHADGYKKPSKPQEPNEDDELFTLRNAARPLGLHVGRHERFDPAIGGGEYYVMEKKTSKDQRSASYLKYATSQEVEEFLERQAASYT
jgi:hypothetical protein